MPTCTAKYYHFLFLQEYMQFILNLFLVLLLFLQQLCSLLRLLISSHTNNTCVHILMEIKQTVGLQGYISKTDVYQQLLCPAAPQLVSMFILKSFHKNDHHKRNAFFSLIETFRVYNLVTEHLWAKLACFLFLSISKF